MSLADRLAPSGGNSRPSSAAGGRGGRGGFQQARTTSSTGRASPRNQVRSAPYAKVSPGFTSNSSSSNGGGQSGIDGTWNHDLFDKQSDSLSPQVNTSFGKAKRSNSGGVFGRALGEISSSSLSARASAKSPPMQSPPVSNSIPTDSQDIFGRFGISTGSSSKSPALPAALDSEAAHREREERLRQKAEWEARQREQDEQKRRLVKQKEKEREEREKEEQRQREALLQQEALDMQTARQQEEQIQQQRQLKSSQATLVIVQNLVEGTTPEDVKAALGDFGEILSCELVESNGDTVSMQLEFTNRKDAQSAVEQLDGVLADGKTLRLTIKERPQPQPVRSKTMGIPLKGAKTRQENGQASNLQRNNGLNNRRSAPQSLPSPSMDMDIISPPSSSKLHSDRVAEFDTRAYIQVQPQHQQFARAPRKPEGQQQQQQQQQRRNGPSSQQQSNPSSSSANIAARFGIQPQANQSRNGSQQYGSGQGQRQGQNGGASGLLGRLGGPARRDSSAMDTS